MKAYPPEVRARALEMRAKGVPAFMIMEKLGISDNTLYRWTHPEYAARQSAQGRARKDKYRGRCEVCGSPTDGSAGPGRAPRFCTHHEPRLKMKARRGTGPTQLATLDFLSTGPKRFMEIREHLQITNWHTGVHLSRLHQYGLIKRVSRGMYALVTKEET